MRILMPVAVIVAVISSSPALAWGPIGHRITGAIADDNLSGVAHANVRLLIGSETLAEASTWPDDMRSDPASFWQKLSPPWHYITVPEGDTYKKSFAPPEGDAMTALDRFTAILRDSKAPLDDKRLALRFVVHIIGDLHQPLHVGRGNDRGGNDTSVTFFNKPTNLHSLWDSGLIDERKLSYSEYASFLERAISPEQVIAWSDPRPATWITESARLREKIYPADPKLSWTYAYEHRSDLDQRLTQAGVRIAAYLNWVFTPPTK